MDDERSGRIEDKLDAVKDDIGTIKVTLAEQHLTLLEHMARTKQLENRMSPLEHRHLELTGIVKALSFAAGVIFLTAAIAEIIGYFHVK